MRGIEVAVECIDRTTQFVTHVVLQGAPYAVLPARAPTAHVTVVPGEAMLLQIHRIFFRSRRMVEPGMALAITAAAPGEDVPTWRKQTMKYVVRGLREAGVCPARVFGSFEWEHELGAVVTKVEHLGTPGALLLVPAEGATDAHLTLLSGARILDTCAPIATPTAEFVQAFLDEVATLVWEAARSVVTDGPAAWSALL